MRGVATLAAFFPGGMPGQGEEFEVLLSQCNSSLTPVAIYSILVANKAENLVDHINQQEPSFRHSSSARRVSYPLVRKVGMLLGNPNCHTIYLLFGRHSGDVTPHAAARPHGEFGVQGKRIVQQAVPKPVHTTLSQSRAVKSIRAMIIRSL